MATILNSMMNLLKAVSLGSLGCFARVCLVLGFHLQSTRTRSADWEGSTQKTTKIALMCFSPSFVHSLAQKGGRKGSEVWQEKIAKESMHWETGKGRRSRRQKSQSCLSSNPSRTVLPTRWAGKARMCGKQRLPKSWKFTCRRRSGTPGSVELLDLSPCGPACHHNIYPAAHARSMFQNQVASTHATQFMEAHLHANLQHVSNTVEGGAGGIARTKRRRKQKIGAWAAWGNETNNLLKRMFESRR